jgi:hypothetical protein
MPGPDGRAPTFHPLASIFPLLEGDEFEALVEDIREHGLRELITLYQGAILDGRNRFRACLRAEVKPRFQNYEGDDPLGFVHSKNFHRRHLTDSQRALAAARAETTEHGGDRKSSYHDAMWHLDRTAAAKKFRVAPRSIARAALVLGKGVPDLVKAVEQGQVKVSRAATIAKQSPAEQEAWLADPEKMETKWRAAKEKAEPREERKAREAKQEAELDRSTTRNAFLLRAGEVIRAAELTCDPIRTFCKRHAPLPRHGAR